MNITIAGAGIAGLTAALALHRFGHAVTVLERTPAISPVGAGIVLAPNAIHILRELGVDLSAVGRALPRISVRTAAGSPLQTVEPGNIAPDLVPPLAFARAELHQALLSAMPGDVPVRLGREWEPGSDSADLLIGADGLRSVVRNHICGPIPLLYSGVTCWRAILPDPGVDEEFEIWGGAGRVGGVPLTGDRLYVFLVLTAPPALPRQTSVSDIRDAFRSLAAPVPRILEALESIPLLHHDLEELPEPVWGRVRTVLIGDAAHAMTPNLGQGAGMAIEDAAVLPQVVSQADPADELCRLRHARVRAIQLNSRRLGQLAHWSSAPATLLRDTLIRMTPRAISDSSYRRLIRPGVAIAQSLQREK